MSDMRTDAIHAGREDLHDIGAHVPPIDLSTTFPVPTLEEGGKAYDTLASGGRPAGMSDRNLVYQRLWSPNCDRFERGLAALEHAEDAVSFASGMAAVTAMLLTCVNAGKPHVVAVRPLYGGTDHLLTHNVLGTRTTFTDIDGIADAVTDETGLVMVETPANPTLNLLSIKKVVEAAGDVPVAVDNTFATPVLQNPLDHGATLTWHSATKYIGGHGDLLGGIIAGPAEMIHPIRSMRAITGAMLFPQAAYMFHRGLQTLPIRVLAQQETAQRVAQWLDAHDAVARVYYPGMGETPDTDGVIGTQMRGPGAMLAFAPKGGFEAARVASEAGRMIPNAVSLGGTDSLIQHPAGLTHRIVPEGEKPNADVLRLSVGLESFEAITEDLELMLKAAANAS